jgi:hypothetical protein
MREKNTPAAPSMTSLVLMRVTKSSMMKFTSIIKQATDRMYYQETLLSKSMAPAMNTKIIDRAKLEA